MLTASASTPNMQSENGSRTAPTPHNWHGVTEGLRRANQHVCDGLYPKAVEALKEILEFAPSEPKAWSLLGEILAQHGHAEKAAACHDKAATLNKSSSSGDSAMPESERLAKLLWSQGETDAARAMLAVLLLRNPDSESLIEMRDSWSASDSEGSA